MKQEKKREQLMTSDEGWGQTSSNLCFGKIVLVALDQSKVSRPLASEPDPCDVTCADCCLLHTSWLV